MEGYIIGIIMGTCIIIWSIYVNLFYDKVVGTVTEGGSHSYDMCIYEYQGIIYKSLANTLFPKHVGRKEKIWVCKDNPDKVITNQWYLFGLGLGIILVVLGIDIIHKDYM